MTNPRAIVATIGIAFVIAIGAMAGRGTVSAAGPAPINLGTVANFSVLAGSAVTNTGPITTDRDVGVWAGTFIAGFTGPPNGALPSTSTDPSGPLTVLGVALTGIGVLLLRGRTVRHL